MISRTIDNYTLIADKNNDSVDLVVTKDNDRYECKDVKLTLTEISDGSIYFFNSQNLDLHVFIYNKVMPLTKIVKTINYDTKRKAILSFDELDPNVIKILPVDFWRKFYETYQVPFPIADNYIVEFQIFIIMEYLKNKDTGLRFEKTSKNICLYLCTDTFNLPTSWGNFPVNKTAFVNNYNKDHFNLLLFKDKITINENMTIKMSINDIETLLRQHLGKELKF